MLTVPVDLPTPAPIFYEIRIGPGLLAQLGPMVRALAPAPTCGIVSDTNVAARYLPHARASLAQAGYRVIDYVFPAGESHKTLATVAAGLDIFLNARIERATPIVALGGGVVGDLAGFISASLLRGTPFIQVPTTLLSAVDASVGGKVGVDHPAGKNLIGAFHQPRLVLTDVATFATLPDRELRCGLAECIKHGIIRDEKLLTFIETHHAALLARDTARLAELVAWNVRIKAAIVRADPFEKSVRALLNLGHTFGHAFETLGSFSDVQHGEAVALGIVAADRLAERRGQLTASERQRVETLLGRVGLPTSLPGVDPQRVLGAMQTDKKVAAGRIGVVLPRGLGDAEVVRDVADGDLIWAVGTLG
jgi:3-dehydroquinate synthase